MAISDELKYYLNNLMGPVARKVGLGDLVSSATGDTGTLVDGKIFVGNASDVATQVTPTGDVTITNAGVTAIGASKVVKSMLHAGVRPSHMVVFAAANVASVALAANVIAIPGVLATDAVFVQLRTEGTTPRTILSAVPAADQITVTFSGDPSTDHAFDYQVVRATT